MTQYQQLLRLVLEQGKFKADRTGTVQTLQNVAGGRHIIVDEDKNGAAAVNTVVPGQTISP